MRAQLAVGFLVGLAAARAQQAAASPFIAAVTAAEAAAATGDMTAARAAVEAVLAASGGATPFSDGDIASCWRAIGLARASWHVSAERTLLERLLAGLAARAPGDADLLAARGRLAMVSVESGSPRQALPMLLQDEALLAELCGEDDPRLHVARARIARVRRNLGEIDVALALGTQAVAALERLLAADAVDLQVARHALAMTKRARGDLAGALALLQQAHAVLSGTLPPSARELLSVRTDLGGTLLMLGDPAAGPLQEQVLALYERDLPEGHPVLHLVRSNVARELLDRDPLAARPIAERALSAMAGQDEASQPLRAARLTTAACRRACGDAAGALQLDELAIASLAGRQEHDPELLLAQLDLAESRRADGDLQGALALQERLVAVLGRFPGHPLLPDAEANLAVTVSRLGDWPRALAICERVLAERRRTTPVGHPRLLRAEANAAHARMQCGDPFSALPVQQGVLAELRRRDAAPSPLHLDVQRELAGTLAVLGDFGGALAQLQTVRAALEARRPADDPAVLSVHAHMAVTLVSLGDHAQALALQRSVLAARERTLRPDDPLLQSARTNLAYALRASGDPAAAASLQREVLAAAQAALPEGHVDVQLARMRLALTLQHTGELAEAAALLDGAVVGLQRGGAVDRPEMFLCLAAATRALAAIGDRERAVRRARECERLVLTRLGQCTLSPREVALWCRTNGDIVDVLGSLVCGVAPLPAVDELAGDWLLVVEAMRGVEVRAARLARRAAAAGDRREVDELCAAWRDASCRLADVSQRSAGSGDPGLRGLAEARDRSQRRLHEIGSRLRGYDPVAVTIGGLGRALGATAAAVSLRSYLRGVGPAAQWHVLATVLRPDGGLATTSIGQLEAIEAMAQELAERGLFARARGELVKQVVAPILACLPPGVTDLVLAADDVLQLVPFDALELADGRLLGETLRVHRVDSLFDLLEPTAAPAPASALVAVGDVAYGAPGPDPGVLRGGASAGPRRLPTWKALAHTKDEVAGVVERFAASVPQGKAIVQSGAAATPSALRAAAPLCSHLHLATHGWFVPELLNGRSLRIADDASAWQLEGQAPISALAPMTLCGLALAGANQDAVGASGRAGTMTAEELLAIDLSRCELVVLSVCEGAAGLLQRGRGLASLRAGLQGAGARFVLASPWPVDDAATKALMLDFYARLFQAEAAGRDPRDALWQARLAARQRGVPFRDWAGWLLVGR